MIMFMKNLVRKQKKIFSSPKMLLVSCPQSIMFPIQIIYLSAFLNQKGIDHKLIDLNYEIYVREDNDVKKKWEEDQEFWKKQFKNKLKKAISYSVDRILGSGMGLVGFSVHQFNYEFSLEIAKRVKILNPMIKIVFGGAYCENPGLVSQIPERYVDFIVKGKGYNAIEKIIRSSGTGIERVMKVYDASDPDIPRITDKINTANYQVKYRLVQSSHGCISRCFYCGDAIGKGKFQVRNPENVVKEIRHYNEKDKITDFIFTDLLINGDIDNLEKMCNLLIDSGLKIRWRSHAMFRDDMSYRLYRKMRLSGCEELFFGLESGSDNVLKKMNKPVTADIAHKNLKDAKEAGIRSCVSLIVGYPGETDDDFKSTTMFLEKNRDYISKIASISVCRMQSPSIMFNRYSSFAIKPPKDEYWFLLWEDKSGNNYELRKRRAYELLDKVQNLGIEFEKDNSFHVFEEIASKALQLKKSVL